MGIVVVNSVVTVKISCPKHIKNRTILSCACGMELCSRTCYVSVPRSSSRYRRRTWYVKSVAGGNEFDPSSANSNNGRTRLIQALLDIRVKLSKRIREIRKDLPMKLLFLLVGFYCATAFSTVIGQTGDWDILSAGLAVVVVEGIGALMYNASFPLLNKIKSLITMFNFWKAGLTLGLFLDSFKYEVDNMLGPCNPFIIDIDVFSIFL